MFATQLACSSVSSTSSGQEAAESTTTFVPLFESADETFAEGIDFAAQNPNGATAEAGPQIPGVLGKPASRDAQSTLVDAAGLPLPQNAGDGTSLTGATANVTTSRPPNPAAGKKYKPFALPFTVSISGSRGLTPNQIANATEAATDKSLSTTIVDQGTIEGIGLRRANRLVRGPRSGTFVPLSVQAIEPAAATELLGEEISDVLVFGDVVLGETSAKIRQAQVGDELIVRGWNDTESALRIGAIVEDQRVYNAEILLSKATAGLSLGLARPSRVVAWKLPTKKDQAEKIFTKLKKELTSETTKVSASWEPAKPDDVLSQVKLKTLLGEFAMQRVGSEIRVDSAWSSKSIVTHNFPILGNLTCHKALVGPLTDALLEIERDGLAAAIDPIDSKNGGCFVFREVRSSSGTSGRNLSRHSWGGAFDINPSTNAFGAKPKIHPCLVEIFRGHGFAWGGSFTIPDGMHFEYVGEARGPKVPACALDARSKPPLTRPTTTTTTTTTTTSTTTTTVVLPVTIPPTTTQPTSTSPTRTSTTLDLATPTSTEVTPRIAAGAATSSTTTTSVAACPPGFTSQTTVAPSTVSPSTSTTVPAPGTPSTTSVVVPSGCYPTTTIPGTVAATGPSGGQISPTTLPSVVVAPAS